MMLAAARGVDLDAVLTRYRTADGGASHKEADLWCTYATVRALAWLGERPADAEACASYLTGCQNADGGFAWQRGMSSDVWATYYCTQALQDLGVEVAGRDRLAAWVGRLATPDGGYGMTPGQPPDVWATYYGVRVQREVLGEPLPDLEALRHWLRATQRPEGGLAWSPESRSPDVRACYYAIHAWRYAAAGGIPGPGWNQGALVEWVRARQRPDGGFVFGDTGDEACLWATFRAIRALACLGALPRDPAACAAWVRGRRLVGQGFTRWASYGVADVWACFSAVGALTTLGDQLTGQEHREVIDFLRGCQLPRTGFTYRAPADAGDCLATAALCMLSWVGGQSDAHKTDELVAWLHRAHMPYEDGVMYMPARGAEVRCTLWALAALHLLGASSLDATRVRRWVRALQNPDGGFGLWLGRGSDVVATVSAVESLAHLSGDGLDAIDSRTSRTFLLACRGPGGMRLTPGGEVALRFTCQGVRALLLLDATEAAEALAAEIPAHASRLGGYASSPGGIPDLVSTYQAVLTLGRLGQQWDREGVRRLLNHLRRSSGGYAWSPLGRDDGGPLASCLAELLRHAAAADVISGLLPRINL